MLLLKLKLENTQCGRQEVVVAPEAIIAEETPQDDGEKASDGRERGPDGKFIDERLDA